MICHFIHLCFFSLVKPFLIQRITYAQTNEIKNADPDGLKNNNVICSNYFVPLEICDPSLTKSEDFQAKPLPKCCLYFPLQMAAQQRTAKSNIHVGALLLGPNYKGPAIKFYVGVLLMFLHLVLVFIHYCAISVHSWAWLVEKLSSSHFRQL